MTRRWYLLFGLLLALLTPIERAGAVVATIKVTLATNSWTDLGVGPLLLSSNGMVVYAVADATPSIPVQQGFPLPVDTAVTVNTASHIWAMSASNIVAYVYVSPIVAGGGSGGSLTWPGSATVTNYGTAPTGTVPAVNAYVTNPPTLTWPGTAAATNYGTAPTGTVPGVNAYVTSPPWPGTAAVTSYGTAPIGTVPAVNASVTSPPGTAGLSAYGTAPSGTVPAVNAFVTNSPGSTVTQGAAGASPWLMDTTGSGNLDNEIKGPVAAQAAHGVNIGGIEGSTASGITPTEYPVYEGGRGATTFPTAVADTQKVGRMHDKFGRTVTVSDAPADLWFTATATSSAGPTTLVAADASNKIALVNIECDTQAASAAAGVVVLTDTAANTMARLGLPNAGNGSAHFESLRQPKRTSAINSAVSMTITGGQSTTCTVDYYKVPS